VLPLKLDLVIHEQRRMIGKALRLVDRYRSHLAAKPRGDHLIIDAPTDVLGPRLTAIRPPRILIIFLIDDAKRIDETEWTENVIQPSALLW